MSDHDLARQVAAMRTELREVHRLVKQLTDRAAHPTGKTEPVARPDGSRFLPGTGTIGEHRELSDEAKAALAALDERDDAPAPARPALSLVPQEDPA